MQQRPVYTFRDILKFTCFHLNRIHLLIPFVDLSDNIMGIKGRISESGAMASQLYYGIEKKLIANHYYTWCGFSGIEFSWLISAPQLCSFYAI